MDEKRKSKFLEDNLLSRRAKARQCAYISGVKCFALVVNTTGQKEENE